MGRNRYNTEPNKSIFSGVSKLSTANLEADGYGLISFRHFDKNQGAKLSEWEKDALLTGAIDTLSSICFDKLTSKFKDKKYTIYGDFPPADKTEFKHPTHVPPDAKWARIHVTGKQCIVGHIVRNVFYIVFLDTHHRFWISEKK